MDLTFSADETAFRDEIRTWLVEHRPDEAWAPMDTAEGFEQHRGWERTLFDAGWSVPNWPTQYGGRECSLIEWLLYEEEYYLSGAPGRVNTNGITLLGPTLFGFGTPEQQDRFFPPMASGEEIWAQGWSEPDSGSDLASLKTTAVRDGDHYVLNGQKTWCSRGAWADWIFCIVRTDPDSERHRGLSYLLVPADAPGLTRRPVSRLDGEPAFAELFFDDCRVPISGLLGEEGAGWNVAMATASSERGLNLRAPGRFLAAASQLVALYRGLLADGVVMGDVLRDRVIDALTDAEAYRWQVYRKASELMHGGSMGSEASYMKVFWSELDVDIHATALDMLAERGELVGAAPDAADAGAWMTGYLFALAGPIYAGTNEIQRNIIAERVLGLPKKVGTVDFRFTEDQVLFADTVRDILTNECPPAAVRDAWGNETGAVPGLWDTLAATGVVGLTAPESAGGLSMTDLDLVLIMEEFGRAACPEVVLEHTAVALPLLAAAPEAIAARWLAPAAAGEARVSASLGSAYVLGAAQSDLLILRHGDALHAVPTADATLTAQASVDETRRLASVAWTPTADTLVTDDPAAIAAAERRAAVAAAAQCVGIAQQLLDMTVEYVQERRQFGSPVGVNQAVKHHLADVGKAIEFARPMTYRAAWCLGAGGLDTTEVATAVAMAKLLASDAVDLACRSSLQCHGAIAYTVEYDLQLWLKRGWALAAAWGSAREQRRALAP